MISIEEKVKMNVSTFKPAFDEVDALLEFFCNMHELYTRNPRMQAKNFEAFVEMTSNFRENLKVNDPQHMAVILLLESVQTMGMKKYNGLRTFKDQLMLAFANSFYSVINQQVRENRMKKQY